MSSYNVMIIEVAQRDLLDIFDYIAFELRDPDSTIRLLSKIRSKVKSLYDFPEQNNLISEPKYEEQKIRWCPVENYIVFYKVSKEKSQVYLIRILYKKETGSIF